MKSLEQTLNESLNNTNESFLTIAGGVIAGLLGLKVLRALVSTGLKAFANNVARKEFKKLDEEYTPRLETLLQAHPKSYEWVKSYYNTEDASSTLTRLDGTLGSVTFVDDVLSKDDWTEVESNEFRRLWDRAFTVNKALRIKMAQELINSISK